MRHTNSARQRDINEKHWQVWVKHNISITNSTNLSEVSHNNFINISQKLTKVLTKIQQQCYSMQGGMVKGLHHQNWCKTWSLTDDGFGRCATPRHNVPDAFGMIWFYLPFLYCTTLTHPYHHLEAALSPYRYLFLSSLHLEAIPLLYHHLMPYYTTLDMSGISYLLVIFTLQPVSHSLQFCIKTCIFCTLESRQLKPFELVILQLIRLL